MRVRTLLVLGLLALAGCAPFPKGPPLIGYDPAPYGDAFRAAATEAVVRSKLGEGFYEVFGEKAYTVGQSGLCAEDTFQRFLSLQHGCALLVPGRQFRLPRTRPLHTAYCRQRAIQGPRGEVGCRSRFAAALRCAHSASGPSTCTLAFGHWQASVRQLEAAPLWQSSYGRREPYRVSRERHPHRHFLHL